MEDSPYGNVATKKIVINDLTLAAIMLVFSVLLYILNYDYYKYGNAVFCGIVAATIIEAFGIRRIMKSNDNERTFLDQAVSTIFAAMIVLLAFVSLAFYNFGYDYVLSLIYLCSFVVDMILINIDKAPYKPITKIYTIAITALFIITFVDWYNLSSISVVFYTMVVWQMVLLCIYVNFDSLESISAKFHSMAHGGKEKMDRIFKGFMIVCLGIVIVLWSLATVFDKTGIEFVGWYPTYSIFDLPSHVYAVMVIWALLGVAWVWWARSCYKLDIPRKVKLMFLLIMISCAIWAIETYFNLDYNILGEFIYLLGGYGIFVAMVILATYLHEIGYTFWGMFCLMWITFSLSVPPLIWGYDVWNLFIIVTDYVFFLLIDFTLCRGFLTGGEPVL